MSGDPMDYSAARRAMIDNQLRPEAVTDAAVLAAMARVPREEYVSEAARSSSYVDRPINLGSGRAMMPPAALGRLLSELAPRPGERALVVGAASGYSAALLEAIGLDVTSIEGLDLTAGEGDVFDLILIDGAVEHIPQPLVDRLAQGGRLGAGLRGSGVTRLVIGRAAGGRLGIRAIVDADVPPLPIFTLPPAFTF
ncbi:MAG: protein-L-isoaspartate O-methyltransferase [Pseudomonadota bacterium]|nr:protein-L-isoaspartate O-methyltransferase [Pseudomonadota bacterium]